MKHIEKIVPGLRKCDRKCRKCFWRDGFSGACTLRDAASNYIEILEADNRKKMVYCKDCIFCEKKDANYRWQDEEYTCKHSDGLRRLGHGVNPMDYCSVGVAKE